MLSARLEVLDCSVLDAVALCCMLPGGNTEHIHGGLVARRWLLTEMFFSNDLMLLCLFSGAVLPLPFLPTRLWSQQHSEGRRFWACISRLLSRTGLLLCSDVLAGQVSTADASGRGLEG